MLKILMTILLVYSFNCLAYDSHGYGNQRYSRRSTKRYRRRRRVRRRYNEKRFNRRKRGRGGQSHRIRNKHFDFDLDVFHDYNKHPNVRFRPIEVDSLYGKKKRRRRKKGPRAYYDTPEFKDYHDDHFMNHIYDYKKNRDHTHFNPDHFKYDRSYKRLDHHKFIPTQYYGDKYGRRNGNHHGHQVHDRRSYQD